MAGQSAETHSIARRDLVEALDAVQHLVLKAPLAALGALAVNKGAIPVEVEAANQTSVTFRRATAEPEVIPTIADTAASWKHESR